MYSAVPAHALRVKGGASCGNLGTQRAASFAYKYQYFTLAYPVKDEAPVGAFCERPDGGTSYLVSRNAAGVVRQGEIDFE